MFKKLRHSFEGELNWQHFPKHEHLFHIDCLIFKIKIVMKKYICTVCQWVYDPKIGDPEQGIEPGVAFENLPDDYVCPLCGVGKEEFEVEE